MTIDISNLRRVLLSEAQPNIAERALSVIGPTAVKAASGEFNLDGRHSVSDQMIREALQSALGTNTSKVARISLSEGPFSKPFFMTLEFYRDCLHSFLQQNIVHKLHYKIRDEFNPRLQESFPMFSTEQNFHDLLGRHIRSGLKNAMRLSERHEKQWEDAWKETYRAIQAVLVCYIGFAQINDRDGMKRLEPLAQIIHRAVPIGCKSFEYETRIVFVN
jgi:hypothetical protein